jgi:hypothetical protein
MGVFEMVVLIVVVGCVTGVVNNFIKTRKDQGGEDLDDIFSRLEQMDDLENRVRVLEAVVTDENYDLKRKFSDLEKE